MSDYPSWITPAGELYCQAPGCVFTPETIGKGGNQVTETTPRFAVNGTDLCRWHHAQFVRVLGDLVTLWPDLLRASYSKTTEAPGFTQFNPRAGGGGTPSDVGTNWNPHVAAVIAELGDWTRYLVRTVIRERPLDEPFIQTFPRTETTYTLEGVKEVRTYLNTRKLEHTHGITEDEDVRSQLAALAGWHAYWLSAYPFVGPFLLADALQHRRAGMRALQTQPVKRFTLKNAVCHELVADEDFGPLICGAPLYAILRPEDTRPSEILCSTNPRHPQLSREEWMLAAGRSTG